MDEGDIKPSEHYLEEVREYFRQHVSEDSLSRVARQVYGSKAYLIMRTFSINITTPQVLSAMETP